MKKILITLFLAILVAGATSAVTANNPANDLNDQGTQIEQVTIPGWFFTLETQEICESSDRDALPDPVRRGCCSWHGGVCGCDEATDRIVCCDGTLSPSCTCSGY